MKHLNVLLLVVSATILGACSKNPSAAIGERVMRKLVQNNSNGCVEVVSYNKTNGVLRETGGAKTYDLECNVTIKFAQECWFKTFGEFEAFKTDGMNDSVDANRPAGYERHSKGDHLILLRKLKFELTDNGWRDQWGDVY